MQKSFLIQLSISVLHELYFKKSSAKILIFAAK